MMKFITLTLLSAVLCFSGSIVFAGEHDQQSNETENNNEKPKNIIESVKQRLKNSEELEKENREKALENDLQEDPQ